MAYCGKKKIVYIFPLKGNSYLKTKCRVWENKYEYLDIIPTNQLSNTYKDSEIIMLYKISDYDTFSYKEHAIIEANKVFAITEANISIENECIIISERYDVIEKKLSEFNKKFQDEIISRQ